MRSFPPAFAAFICLALTAPAHAATGDKLDRSKLVLTFSDEFDGRPLDIWNAAANPKGRWKTCYWFGWQPCMNWSARSVGPTDTTIASDPAYNGVNPFGLWNDTVNLTIQKNYAPTLGANQLGNGPAKYTVGLLTTEMSFSQTYGYFEIKASLPNVKGAWPAFWLLDKVRGTSVGQDEIDVVEGQGVNPTDMWTTAHWSDGSQTGSQIHTTGLGWPRAYGVLWTKDALVWYVDGVEVFRTANKGLNKPMYMIVSLGVGGWAGSGNTPEDAAKIVGAQMAVDYVRAYALN